MKTILIFILISFSTSISLSAAHTKDIKELAKKYLGGKYTWGGNSPKTGMDCSGYTKFIFNKVGINLPRTAWQQSKVGTTVYEDNLQKGDLLFFNTDPKRGIPVTHVGVYLENGKFIHAASSKKGIIISPLAGFYKKTFLGAKRILSFSKKTLSKNVSPNTNNILTPSPQTLPQSFFTPSFEEALVATSKVIFMYDPLVLHNGSYIKKSQIKGQDHGQ